MGPALLYLFSSVALLIVQLLKVRRQVLGCVLKQRERTEMISLSFFAGGFLQTHLRYVFFLHRIRVQVQHRSSHILTFSDEAEHRRNIKKKDFH